MKAVRWHGQQDVRLDDVEPPGPVSEGQVLVEVSHCGICGTDIAEYRSGPHLIRSSVHPLTGRRPPITIGHEFSGRCVAVGPDVDLPVGSRVTADACWRCGECARCRAGDYHLCRYGGSIGLHSDGAMAPLVMIPSYCAIPVGEGVDDRIAALTEPAAVALHALERADLQPGDDVLVIGFGPIGAAAALIARSLGGATIVVEPLPARRDRCEAMGMETIDAGEDLPKHLRRRLGRGGADVVIESSGVPEVLPLAISCADRGGRIATVGMSRDPSPVDVGSLTLYERSVVGSLGYRHHLPKVLNMVEQGLLDLEPMIGGVVRLADAPGTIAELATNPDERIKVLVDVGADEHDGDFEALRR